MAMLSAEVVPITLVAPTSTPEPSIGDRSSNVIGLGGNAAGMTWGATGGLGGGSIISRAIGATRGTAVRGSSGIVSAGARMAGGVGIVSLGDRGRLVVALGPQANKPSMQADRRISPRLV